MTNKAEAQDELLSEILKGELSVEELKYVKGGIVEGRDIAYSGGVYSEDDEDVPD